MKNKIVILINLLFCFQGLIAETYYVSSTGNDANAGTLLSPWKTMTHASSLSNAGDTIYVKAGGYNEHVIVSKSGTALHPIVFLGYQNSPGDNPPVLVNNNVEAPSGFLTSDMPTFNGGDRAAGIGFYCEDQRFVVLKNFQIMNYAYGLFVGGTDQNSGNFVLDNINVMSIGDIYADYAGPGILLGSMGTKFSNDNTITNCLVVNAAAEGFGINGNYNTLTHCKVYCNENTANAAMDYYVIVTGNYNTLSYCYIERKLGLSHWGHGYTAKTNSAQTIDQGLNLPSIDAQYNKFYYCEAKNMGESFCVRHRTAQYNLFYHCKATGSHTGDNDSPGGEGNGVMIRDGASDNIFDGIIAENCNAAFEIGDSGEDGDMGPNPPGHPGNNNIIINSLSYNCYVGVSYTDEGGIPSDAGDNTIANCTFYKTRYLHYAGRSCKNMKYIGNIYYGCLPSTPGGYFKGNVFAADIVPNGVNTYFKNCNFYNIEGGMPANFVANSTGSISKDPQFRNASTKDFHLKLGSPFIDVSTTLAYANYDYDSIKRPQGLAYDMGAFEYAASLPISLLYFNGRISQQTAILTWATDSEQNNKLFNIQHSTDGIHYTTIGNVNGSGTTNSQHNYEFTDNHPVPDSINYYRIVQVDINGQSNASNIIALHFEDRNFNLVFYPNPAQNNLLVKVPDQEKKLLMKIFDVSGKMQWSKSYYNTSSLVNIDISRLGKGAYELVVIMDNGIRKTATFIKQ
ncbi:MAG: T9SS type A sorting domain-containing protein [Ginsengibacter sp.]